MIALVIEDDPVLRHFLRRLLERHGMHVLLAESAEQGVDVIAGTMGRSSTRAPAVVVYGEALVRGAPAHLKSRIAELAPDLPIVTYGGATVQPAGNGQRRRLTAGGPFDAEALVRSIVYAVGAGGENSATG